MNVLICTLNSQYIHSSLAPFCLLAGLKKYGDSGIYAEVIQGTVNEDINMFAEKLIQKKPHVVGLSCYIWNIEKIYILAALIKDRLPDTVTVLGGPEVSYNAATVLQNNNVDFVLSGEGEKPFALFINALKNNSSLENLPGLCRRTSSGIVVADPYVSAEEPPSPYTEEYFKALNGKIAYIETSRGCPYNCAFCLSGRCGKARFFNLDRAKKDIELLAQSGTKTIKFVDRTFNANKKRAKEIIRFITENLSQSGVCFHFEIAGDILDDELILLLNSSPKGLFQLEIGLQSFNEKTLSEINRKTNTKNLKQNISRLLEFQNVHIHIDLIAGLPYEDMQSFINSFNIAFSLRPHMLQFGFLKLLHGSPMRENKEKYPCEFSKTPPYEVISTPWLTKEELSELHYAENALDRIYNSGRFSKTLEYVLKTKNISPYELFNSFGKYYSKTSSLDDLSKAFFDFFSDNTEEFRDCFVIDRLQTNASGKLPTFLKRTDSRLKEFKYTYPPKKGVTRGYAILYEENVFIYVDYENKDPVTGEYTITKISL
ncbi:MAG: hypothetical protein DBX47_00030 [Clostridiales bacterium]|nr:MAG: hypothetical protein DBX47_00030 [Clostridiales bacterium]